MSVMISGPPDAIRGSKVDVERMRRHAGVVLKAIGQSRAQLSVALVDDREMEALNRRWRNEPRTTDVLSFSLVEGDFADHRGGMLGDVVISVETAARQAAERHRGLDENVARLLIHGVLHLIGHDHDSDEEARVMQREERRVWRVLGA
ncbi:MAG: rRNA maturation RNase YbeY [Deltaproteobacteria bacterium]|jgi:probable rRNA maturation factor|nr:rRNA maturation RNase YbeY [Deltaproteobacteria bacterium]